MSNEQQLKEVKKSKMKDIKEITMDDAYDIALLIMSSDELEEDEKVEKDEIDCDIIPNDDGLMLDGDVLVYLDISCRCFFGGLAFKDDGEIIFADEDNEPHPFNKEALIDELEKRNYDVSLFKSKS